MQLLTVLIASLSLFLSLALITPYLVFVQQTHNFLLMHSTDGETLFPALVLMDEEDEDEDLDEEDLDIGTEIDPDSPPWDMYGEPEMDDEETNEDTALLRVKAARTEIIVTPISPVIK